MNIAKKIEQVRSIHKASKRPLPLILDLMRIKRSDYLAECKGFDFELHAASHEWYTLYENVIREDYFHKGVSLRQGDTVIDIGAHFGSFSAIASKKIGPTGKVIAFEPNPEIYPRLAHNIAINSLGNVVLHNEAVSGENGKLVLLLQQRSSLATVYSEVDGEDRVSQSTRVSVPARSMRSILRSVGGPVDLLKIDCEGAEYDIFDSLDQECISCVRQIAMEVHKIPGRSEHEIVAKLSALGFTVHSESPMITAFKAACEREESEEYERKRRELEEFAKREGAWYYDPESPVVWKRYIIGPVPLWRRLLWWCLPPSDFKMHRIFLKKYLRQDRRRR